MQNVIEKLLISHNPTSKRAFTKAVKEFSDGYIKHERIDLGKTHINCILYNAYKEPEYTDDIFLYFNGRATHLYTLLKCMDRIVFMQGLSDHGSILIFDYVRIKNNPFHKYSVNFDTIIDDFVHYRNFLVSKNINISKMSVIGFSLGSIFASRFTHFLVEQKKFPKQLVLIGSIWQIDRVILQNYHLYHMLYLKIHENVRDNIEKRYNCYVLLDVSGKVPIKIVHGQFDETLTMGYALHMHELVDSSLLIVKGSHQELPCEEICQFIINRQDILQDSDEGSNLSETPSIGSIGSVEN